jgi:hypothetical protein
MEAIKLWQPKLSQDMDDVSFFHPTSGFRIFFYNGTGGFLNR